MTNLVRRTFPACVATLVAFSAACSDDNGPASGADVAVLDGGDAGTGDADFVDADTGADTGADVDRADTDPDIGFDSAADTAADTSAPDTDASLGDADAGVSDADLDGSDGGQPDTDAVDADADAGCADSDSDGVCDDVDVCADGDDTLDADSDGVPDACDVCADGDDTLDADSDGVPDGCDVCADGDDSVDSDADGTPDGCDLCPGFDDTEDTDSDGIPNACDDCSPEDPDADSDGVADACDVCADGDDTLDADSDGVPDACDVCADGDDTLDADSDGVPDACDVCAGGDDTVDTDTDGVPDSCDNCPSVGNGDQLNSESRRELRAEPIAFGFRPPPPTRVLEAVSDNSEVVDIGFDFPLFSGTDNNVRVHTDGTILFGSAPGSYGSGITLDLGSRRDYVAGFMTELNPTKGGAIYVGTGGDEGAREFVVEYQDVRYDDHPETVSMQIVLIEDGTIEAHCERCPVVPGNQVAQGVNLSSWILAYDGRHAITEDLNDDAVRFTIGTYAYDDAYGDACDLCLGDDDTGDGDADGVCDDIDVCVGEGQRDGDGDGVCRGDADVCFGDDASGNDDGDAWCNDTDACFGNNGRGDADRDGVCDDVDACAGFDDSVDADSDGTPDACDACPDDIDKTEPGVCGCGESEADSDSDDTPDCTDLCPDDPGKVDAGVCGCGVADTDSDSDDTLDCLDACPDDPGKVDAGVCGCGVADTDSDSDDTADCLDFCPDDPDKIDVGVCGCGVADTDSDSDDTPDCNDACPDDPAKTEAGVCGCGVTEDSGDDDGDGVLNCFDMCPGYDDEDDEDGDGVPDACDTTCPLGDYDRAEFAVAACRGSVEELTSECGLTIDASVSTDLRTEADTSWWIEYDLGESAAVDTFSFVTDWWWKAVLDFRLFVSDTPTDDPATEATLVYTGVGAQPYLGGHGDWVDQVFYFDEASARYWYFVVDSTHYKETLGRTFDSIILRDIGLYLRGDVCTSSCTVDTDADDVVDCYDLAEGDVVITEVMANPAARDDAVAEWFEVHNPGSFHVRLDGAAVTDDSGESFIIDRLLVPAGGYVVLGARNQWGDNGHVAVDYEYGASFTFDDTGDAITITSAQGVALDRVAWVNGSGWPDPVGASFSFGGDPATDDNSASLYWCASVDAWDGADLGSPGAANAACLVD